MRRKVRIMCNEGEVKKFECPNPDCDEILGFDKDNDDRRHEITCVCGDEVKLLRMGHLPLMQRNIEKKIKKEKKEKDK